MRMSKEEAYKYLAFDTVGYWSDYDGFEIKKLDNDFVWVVSNAFGGKKRVHKVRIHYDLYKNRAYIICVGKRLNFKNIVWEV